MAKDMKIREEKVTNEMREKIFIWGNEEQSTMSWLSSFVTSKSKKEPEKDPFEDFFRQYRPSSNKGRFSKRKFLSLLCQYVQTKQLNMLHESLAKERLAAEKFNCKKESKSHRHKRDEGRHQQTAG